MSRLIDADYLFENLSDVLNQYLDEGLYGYSAMALGFLRYIENQPSVDCEDPIYVDFDTILDEAYDSIDPKLLRKRRAIYKDGKIIYTTRRFNPSDEIDIFDEVKDYFEEKACIEGKAIFKNGKLIFLED